MEVAAGVWRVQSGNEVIYALDCGEGCYALVDVGSAREFPAKLEALRACGITPEHIGAVFVTHFHEDHCGALAALKEQSAARVLCHRLSVEVPSYCIAVSGIPKALADYRVDDGDQVEIGKLSLTVHHLPGHTPDSVAWQFGQDFFVGDLIFEWGGVGWMDVHWGSHVGDYRSSLQQLFRLQPKMLYPGHGEPVAMSRELLDKALANLNALAEADGSPIKDLGRPAVRRHSDVPPKTVRLSTALRRA